MLNRLDLLRVFVAAATAPTFRDAAVRIGASPQVVTRAVRELEETLGETLFHRNTRRVQITTYGERFAIEAQAALDAVDGVFGKAAGASGEGGGTVRITVAAGLGRLYVMPVLADLAIQHPEIVIDLRLSDIPSAVVDEQIDIGVRVGLIADNRFVARHVGGLPIWVVASPELLARVGEPKNLKTLSSMPMTVLIDRATGRPWPWVFSRDEQLIPRAPAFITDDQGIEMEAAEAGLGFSQCPEYLVRSHIATGRLIRVLRRFEPEPWKLHVYRPQRGPVPQRVRIVFDALVKQLGDTVCKS
ncbi:LysR family transcriptional regulator [Paraburkholderia sp. GAS42]|jgi:DNA-binding transcriptional LysR family regulator|uniref:LysR family transcriptional regulator n=1 Tax=Paraburkholderia sp. GAS42 TaxID=3035135 RepID=UPI003D20D334